MGDSKDEFQTVDRKGKRSGHAKPETKPQGRHEGVRNPPVHDKPETYPKGKHEGAKHGPPGVRNPPVHANPKTNEIDELRKENIVWNIRYMEVKKLIEFVNKSMDKKDFKVYIDGQYDEKKTLQKKLSKAGQYVYLHYIAGRLSDKINDEYDPLFCVRNDDHTKLDHYHDPILSSHLKPGDYARFKELEQEAYDVVSGYKKGNALIPITWKDIISDHQNYPIRSSGVAILQRLQDKAHLERGYPNQDKDKNLPKLGEGNQLVVENIIGLTLRYLCIGGFTDAIHSAIPDKFKDFLPGCAECFASPLNYKLEVWYSFFEEDRFFGSLGNFFRECANHGDRLPPNTKFFASLHHAVRFLEINPCWCNSIYEHLARILQNSAEGGMKVVILGPDWHDKPDAKGEYKYAGQENKWAKEFDTLRESQDYKETSYDGENTIEFTIDTSGKTHKQKTKYWVISDVDIPKEIIKGLEERIPEHDDDKMSVTSRRSSSRRGGGQMQTTYHQTPEDKQRTWENTMQNEKIKNLLKKIKDKDFDPFQAAT